MDQGFLSEVVYMDYQRTFDTIPHQQLVVKIKSYGIDNRELLKWIKSFLKKT